MTDAEIQERARVFLSERGKEVPITDAMLYCASDVAALTALLLSVRDEQKERDAKVAGDAATKARAVKMLQRAMQAEKVVPGEHDACTDGIMHAMASMAQEIAAAIRKGGA